MLAREIKVGVLDSERLEEKDKKKEVGKNKKEKRKKSK